VVSMQFCLNSAAREAGCYCGTLFAREFFGIFIRTTYDQYEPNSKTAIDSA
jgi:hypothetical protein